MNELDHRLIGDLAHEVIKEVFRRMQLPEMRPGTVRVVPTEGLVHTVEIDHPDAQEVPAENITGAALAVGERVMILMAPPQGAFVLGRITPHGLLGRVQQRLGSDTSWSTTSTVFVDVDAANLVIPFVAPPSGEVAVVLSGLATVGGGLEAGYWGLREDSSNVANSSQRVAVGTTSHASYLLSFPGLTPGQSYTWKWAFRCVGGVGTAIESGPNHGAALMEIWAL